MYVIIFAAPQMQRECALERVIIKMETLKEVTCVKNVSLNEDETR